MAEQILKFIKDIFSSHGAIPLHEPVIGPTEKKRVMQALDSGFVSTVGKMVPEFEAELGRLLACDNVIATATGTAALHTCLLVSNIGPNDEVITQSFTFVATANAIRYTGAHPVFLDIDRSSLGLCPNQLAKFLEENAERGETGCINKVTGRNIKAVIPMHTFGHPCKISEIATICNQWGLLLIEDAAEALGSTYEGKQMGTFGDLAAFSFNGNKIITSGSGGAIVCKNKAIAARARHLTTTAKTNHPWAFIHDEVGYNYRMSNIHAALGLAQLSRLDEFLSEKHQLAANYQAFFEDRDEHFVKQPYKAVSNYWLNTILFPTVDARTNFLNLANSQGIQARPAWEPLHKLTMFQQYQKSTLDITNDIAYRVVNLPSSVGRKLPHGKT